MNLNSPSDPDFLNHLTQMKLNSWNEHRGRLIGTTNHSKQCIHMNSNDYLCIANHPKIIQRKVINLLQYGHGDSISRVFTYQQDNTLTKFEKRIATLCQSEDAALVMSGYCANTGIIQSFATSDTPIYIDQRAHASLWEGILCAQARAIPFRHNSISSLERKIDQHGPGLIAVDALYSTSGEICPLKKLTDIADAKGCALIVDETHSFGCHGDNGAGLVQALGLTNKVHFRTIGLSKAMSARGGVVLGSSRNIEFFRYESRPNIFSTSVLEYEVAGFNAALDVIADEPWRRSKLHENHRYLKDGLLALGYDINHSDSQIISIVTGDESDTLILKNYLEKKGIIASVFAAPATPKNGSMIRFSVHANLTRSDLDFTISVFSEALGDLNTANWPCITSVLKKTA